MARWQDLHHSPLRVSWPWHGFSYASVTSVSVTMCSQAGVFVYGGSSAVSLGFLDWNCCQDPLLHSQTLRGFQRWWGAISLSFETSISDLNPNRLWFTRVAGVTLGDGFSVQFTRTDTMCCWVLIPTGDTAAAGELPSHHGEKQTPGKTRAFGWIFLASRPAWLRAVLQVALVVL